jgi:hypothetical protein
MASTFLIGKSQSTKRPGNYNVIWTYISNGTAGNEFQTVNVAEATLTNPQSLYAGKVGEFRQVLSNQLAIAQSVVVQNEPARKHNADYSTYWFTFPRWNQSSRTQVYVNRSRYRVTSRSTTSKEVLPLTPR